METRVKAILEDKGRTVFTIDRTETALAAIKKMGEHKVGSLVVMHDGAISGIVTERDFVQKVVAKERSPRETKVSEIMTDNIVCVTPDYVATECMAIMTKMRFRHLPVMDGPKLVGIVSIGDLIKRVSQDREFHIQHLMDYITGKYPA